MARCQTVWDRETKKPKDVRKGSGKNRDGDAEHTNREDHGE